LSAFVVTWHALTAVVEEAMKYDEGPYRDEVVRAVDRPRRGAGFWAFDGSGTE